jgi:hypothetical protein
MTAPDYAANGNAWYSSEDPRLCKASFSGNARASRYRLAAGACVTVSLGDLLFDNGASADCVAALDPNCRDRAAERRDQLGILAVDFGAGQVGLGLGDIRLGRCQVFCRRWGQQRVQRSLALFNRGL